jgi:AraC-like DNA-binding protein
VDRGRCQVEQSGRSFTLEQGQAVLFLPRERPNLTLIPGQPCETISISFVANASLLADVAGKPFTLNAFQQTLLSRLCQLASPGDDSAHRNSEVKLLLIQLLLSTRERPSPASPAPVPPPSMPAYKRARHGAALLGIRRILDESAEGRVRLRDIARHANMSVPTLERLFKLETGSSPIRYHQQQRLNRAKLLLRHSMLTVTQIAEKLGFQSVHHFSSAFKRRAGITPTGYARSVRGAMRQIEEAQQMLREGEPVGRIAAQLGFPSVHAFAQTFRRYTGRAPEEFARGKITQS